MLCQRRQGKRVIKMHTLQEMFSIMISSLASVVKPSSFKHSKFKKVNQNVDVTQFFIVSTGEPMEDDMDQHKQLETQLERSRPRFPWQSRHRF